ncbi:MAG: hypothetical protein WAJ93_14715, partial [Candidatus Nitrosopolaris sp.]
WPYDPGQARLSCNDNINSVQTKTIPMMTILDLIFDFHICYTFAATSISTIVSCVYEKSAR